MTSTASYNPATDVVTLTRGESVLAFRSGELPTWLAFYRRQATGAYAEHYRADVEALEGVYEELHGRVAQ